MKKFFISVLFLPLLAFLAPARARAQAQERRDQQDTPPTIIQPLADIAAVTPADPAADEPLPPDPNLPDAPTQAITPAAVPVAHPFTPNNDRIFMVLPNYATVEQQVAFSPIPAGEKLKLGALDAFDPYSAVLAGAVAGIAQADNDDPSWRQGLKGYSKRYFAAYADQAIGDMMTTGIFPSLLHEDPRYYRKGSGSFVARTGHALHRLFVTKTDSGNSIFNFSEFGGNAVAGALSLTYHSAGERNFSNFASTWGTQISLDFLGNEIKEFWPDIRRKLFHH